MTETWVTRCPGCGTCFRVSESQLGVAKGLVRCGGCLQVFKAMDHLLTPVVPDAGEAYEDVDEAYEPVGEPEEELDEPGEELDEPQEDLDEADATPLEATESGDAEPAPVDEEVPELTWSIDADSLTEEERRNLHNALSFVPDQEMEAVEGVEARSLARWAGWLAVNLLLALVLVAQYGWYHRMELSRRETLRGWYEGACVWLTCALPDYVDTSRLSARNLVVRTHPREKGALIVDAILYNASRFSQPFPQLDLSFSDLDNKRVAARRFRPEEYLHGEVASYRKIPGQTEVRLSLEIVDPGPAAVSYQLDVVGL